MIGWNRWTSTVIWRLKQVLVGSLGVALEQSEQSACLWRLKLGFQTTRLACPTVVALAVCLRPSTCYEMGSGDSILRRLRLWPTQQSCNWADQEQMSWKGQRQDQDANRLHLLWPIFLHARMILVYFGHIWSHRSHVASTGLLRKCMFGRSLSQDISFSEIKDPGVTGNFEIKVNGALVHSKKTMSEVLNVTVTNSAKHQSNVNYMNVCLAWMSITSATSASVCLHSLRPWILAQLRCRTADCRPSLQVAHRGLSFAGLQVADL